MKLRVFVMAAAMLVSPAARALDIYSDMGGNPVAYAQKFRSASKPIRILGICGSACTMALRYGACVGPNAQLWFHAVHGAGASNGIATRWVMGFYPPAVQGWIRARGGLTSAKLVLSGRELHARVQSCK